MSWLGSLLAWWCWVIREPLCLIDHISQTGRCVTHRGHECTRPGLLFDNWMAFLLPFLLPPQGNQGSKNRSKVSSSSPHLCLSGMPFPSFSLAALCTGGCGLTTSYGVTEKRGHTLFSVEEYHNCSLSSSSQLSSQWYTPQYFSTKTADGLSRKIPKGLSQLLHLFSHSPWPSDCLGYLKRAHSLQWGPLSLEETVLAAGPLLPT